MGAALVKKLTGEEKKRALILECYERYVEKKKIDKPEDFYHAACKIVEELNRRYGYTQIKIPGRETLEEKFKHNMTDGEFLKVFQSLVYEVGYTNLGALDPVLLILSAPAVALFLKKAVNHPRAVSVSDQALIPGVTSATVLLLAALKRI